MSAPKPKRLDVKIDMTPMVDIAFLLLIFFMSTTQFKNPAQAVVQLPTSHSKIKLPEEGVGTIAVDSSNVITMTLGELARDFQYGLAESRNGAVMPRIIAIDSLPVEINRLQLKGLINRIAINGDQNAEYGTIEQIMAVLQKNELNIFNLLTDYPNDEKAVKADTGR